MKNYKDVTGFYKKLGISRQGFYEKLSIYEIKLPEPDAMFGTRKMWLDETIDKFLSELPARRTKEARIDKVLRERPELTTITRFIEGKFAKEVDRRGFRVSVIKLTSEGKLHREKIHETHYYKVSELSAVYDKMYCSTFPTVSMAGLREQLDKNPTAITMEEFSLETGLPFPTILSRYYKVTPRLLPVFRASGKNFYRCEDLFGLLKKHHLEIIIHRTKSEKLKQLAIKMSESFDSVKENKDEKVS